MKREKRKQLESNINDYDHEIGRCSIEISDSKKILLSFSNNLNRLSPENNVLSIGCGLGIELAGIQCRRVGLDISKVNLKKAVEFVPDGYFVHGDAENLPFNSGIFDVVLMISLVHHIANHEKLFKETLRVLKENGQLLVMDSNADSQLVIYPISKLALLIAHARGNYAEGYGISLIKGIKMLEEQGYYIEIIDATGSAVRGFWFYSFLPFLDGGDPFEKKPIPLRIISEIVMKIDNLLNRILDPRYLQSYKLVAVKNANRRETPTKIQRVRKL